MKRQNMSWALKNRWAYNYRLGIIGGRNHEQRYKGRNKLIIWKVVVNLAGKCEFILEEQEKLFLTCYVLDIW